MVQGYHTLQEAAAVLDMPVDELKQMAQKNQIRSFQDRGTLRFRIQDIQELQRQRLGNSDPELVLGDALSPKPKVKSEIKAGPGKTPRPQSAAKAGDVFDFDIDDNVDIGREIPAAGGSALRKNASKQDDPKTPKKGTDSDVKLVSDGSDSFSIQLDAEPRGPESGDSDVRLGDIDANRKAQGPSSRKTGLGGPRRQSKLGPSPADSGVRLVPMNNDSDVRVSGRSGKDRTDSGTESDIRLGKSQSHKAAENMINTEEIDLDQEIKKQEAAKKPESKFKPKKSELGKAKVSPFELSDSDIDDVPPKKKSTEFELGGNGKDSDEDFSLELDEDSLDLGGSSADDDAPRSGINIGKPLDAGISLEAPSDESHEEIDFELNLEGAPPTPRPSKKKVEVDSDSEFELSLDDSSGEMPAAKTSDSDSEFELALDDDGSTSEVANSDSDSEFELTLDDAPPAKDKGKAKPKGKGKAAVAEDVTEEKDIFETDFELPALDEAGDDATVDGGSSDFELALDDSDIATEDESGSQVVALDEEDLDEVGNETVDGDFDNVEVEDGDVEVEDEDDVRPVREKVVVQEVVRDRWLKPAPWGVLPTVFMLPCVVVMVLVGIMGWELVQASSGFKSAGLLTRSIAEMMNVKVR